MRLKRNKKPNYKKYLRADVGLFYTLTDNGEFYKKPSMVAFISAFSASGRYETSDNIEDLIHVGDLITNDLEFNYIYEGKLIGKTLKIATKNSEGYVVQWNIKEGVI